ncbi:kinase-like protein [Phanerochaete sordida]|uniref:non-specific serine/threonine protein kinase n=1 Tax=Phanerochaete sordida TaxID=48140 RepID=A0A9P3LC02_9APHY|nr:kinase-like protein [Phanerochaete sordida]
MAAMILSVPWWLYQRLASLWRTNAEPLSDYFVPRPHDKLNRRYLIHTKLGAGVWSSTWLVSDTTAQKDKRYLAVKVLTLDATKEHNGGIMLERKFLQEITDKGPLEHLPALLDVFTVPRSGGQSHLCFAMDVYGQDVASFRRSAPQKALPVFTVKVIIKQVLRGVVGLHRQGIVHTDIKPDNMLLGTKMDADALDEWLKTLGPSAMDGEVHPLPAEYRYDDPREKVKGMNVTLIDLGQAQRAGPVGSQTAKMFSAFSLRAPEIILRSDFGTAIDIWAIGCIVFEMITGRWLFHPEGGDEDWSIEDDHLAKMIELTGERFSAAMLQRSQNAREYFDGNGDLLRVPELFYVKLEDALANYKTLIDDEVGPAAEFIKACIRLEPADRPTAEALQAHPWLTGI